MNRYWPENGELVPSFMEFSTEWLDTPYLRRDTRMQNEDLSIIMAKQGTVGASIRAMRGGKVYDFPIPEGYPVPTSPTDFTDDPYNFTANPLAWAKKAWYLLYNPQWSPVTPNSTENPRGEGWYELVGGQYVLTQDTQVDPYKAYFIGATYTAVTPQGIENPAYEGWFVFDGTNYVMTTDVTVQPGTTYYEAKDGEVNLMSFVIYGDVLYRDKINTLQNDNTKNPKEYTSEYIYDDVHAKAFMNFYWHFLNTSRFSMSWAEPYQDDPLGSVVEITQKGMVYSQDAVIVAKSIQFINDNTPIVSYSAVGVAVPTLEDGVAYSITPQGSANNPTPEEMDDKRETEELKQEVEDIQVNVWDFRLSKSDYIANGRYTGNNAPINIDAKVEGWDITPQWSATCFGNNVNSFLSSTSGKNITITIPYDMDGHGGNNPIIITMSDPNGVLTSIQHSISCTDQTNWNLFCGALGAIPTTYPEGSKFLSGDYFLTTQGFTGTDSKWYKGATPYYYDNGSWWNEMPVSSENYGYLMNCLGAIMDSSTIQPQDGVSAFYGWFKNLTALNAVIENLTAIFLHVGPGNGTAGSGFRFRALNDDGNGSPVFDVYYGNKMLFSVDVSTGKIFFGSDFWYDPSDGAIHTYNDNVVIDSNGKLTASGIVIANKTQGFADFGSAVFSPGQTNSTAIDLDDWTSTQIDKQGQELYSRANIFYDVNAPTSGTTAFTSRWYSCRITDNTLPDAENVRYMRLVYAYKYESYLRYTPLYGVEFADSAQNHLSSLDAYTYVNPYGVTDKKPFSSSTVIHWTSGGAELSLFDLPTSASGLDVGRVWNDNGTLKIVM